MSISREQITDAYNGGEDAGTSPYWLLNKDRKMQLCWVDLTFRVLQYLQMGYSSSCSNAASHSLRPWSSHWASLRLLPFLSSAFCSDLWQSAECACLWCCFPMCQAHSLLVAAIRIIVITSSPQASVYLFTRIPTSLITAGSVVCCKTFLRTSKPVTCWLSQLNWLRKWTWHQALQGRMLVFFRLSFAWNEYQWWSFQK